MTYSNDGATGRIPPPAGPVAPDEGFGPDLATGLDGDLDIDIDADELDAILGRLRGIADAIDAPPSIVAELAHAAFETRDLDSELAILTADSYRDELALVRSVAVEPRMVSFETDAVTVELQLDRVQDTTTVRGLVVGAAGPVTVETADGRNDVALDDRGWFVIEGITSRTLRLHVAATEGPAVTTEWISL